MPPAIFSTTPPQDQVGSVRAREEVASPARVFGAPPAPTLRHVQLPAITGFSITAREAECRGRSPPQACLCTPQYLRVFFSILFRLPGSLQVSGDSVAAATTPPPWPSSPPAFTLLLLQLSQVRPPAGNRFTFNTHDIVRQQPF